MTKIVSLIKCEVWEALKPHYPKIKYLHLRNIFTNDPKPRERMSAEAVRICFEYSTQCVTEKQPLLQVTLRTPNEQHSFYQPIPQGTEPISCDCIKFDKPINLLGFHYNVISFPANFSTQRRWSLAKCHSGFRPGLIPEGRTGAEPNLGGQSASVSPSDFPGTADSGGARHKLGALNEHTADQMTTATHKNQKQGILLC